MKIRCPHCKRGDSRVAYTLGYPEQTYRLRQCRDAACGRYFKTSETVIASDEAPTPQQFAKDMAELKAPAATKSQALLRTMGW